MNYQIQAGTLLEGFEDSTEWTVTGGTASNNTTFVKSGTKSLELVSGAATNCIATKTINLDLSNAGLIYFWIYIPSLTGVTSFQVILSNDSSFTNFFSKTFTAVLHEGWNKVLVGRDQWASSGTPVWTSNMVRLRVRINASAGTPNCYFDGMFYGYYSRPKVMISFDDGWASQYTDGYAYMRKFGLRGTLYLIRDRIDTAGYMTTAQVQELFDAGWDICNHTTTHPNMATELTTQAEVEEELTACRDWIISKGWSRTNGHNHVAYPNGGYDTKVLAAMSNLDMITGRSIINRTQANEIDNQYILTRQSHSYTASAATYKAYVTKTIAEGGSIQINYHKIVADAAGTVDTEVELSQFQDLILFVARLVGGNSIDSPVFTEWYRGLNYGKRLA